MKPFDILSKSSPKASRACEVTLSSRQTLAGPASSSKKRQPAASGSGFFGAHAGSCREFCSFFTATVDRPPAAWLFRLGEIL
jgi:hypothetical protein